MEDGRWSLLILCVQLLLVFDECLGCLLTTFPNWDSKLLWLNLLCPPTRKGGGHIGFGVDPVSARVCVAFCLHSISWMEGWIFTKLAQMHYWIEEKCWLDFGDLELIFKVTGLKTLSNFRPKKLVCTLSPEPMDGIGSNLVHDTCGTAFRTD